MELDTPTKNGTTPRPMMKYFSQFEIISTITGKDYFLECPSLHRCPPFPESSPHTQVEARFWRTERKWGLAQEAWVTSAHLSVFAHSRVLMRRGCWQSGVASSRLSDPQPTLEVLGRVQGVLLQFLGAFWPGR